MTKYISETDIESSIMESMQIAVKYRVLLSKIKSKTEAAAAPIPASPSPQSQVQASRVKAVKLPYLQLKRFNGKPTEWNSFWDSFASAVDNNKELEPVQKFNYLKSYLGGTAVRTIEGLKPTNETYSEAVKLLKERYGNKQVIISSHMRKFAEIKEVKSITDLKELRDLYDKVETNVRSLESMGVSTESYGTFLAPQILQKLPTKLRITLTRKLSDE